MSRYYKLIILSIMEFTTDLLSFSYVCSSCDEELINILKYTNKLLLPQSVLYSFQEK